jgi:hypothetical protein
VLALLLENKLQEVEKNRAVTSISIKQQLSRKKLRAATNPATHVALYFHLNRFAI